MALLLVGTHEAGPAGGVEALAGGRPVQCHVRLSNLWKRSSRLMHARVIPGFRHVRHRTEREARDQYDPRASEMNGKQTDLLSREVRQSAIRREQMIEACASAGVRLMTAYRLHFERTNLEAIEIARKQLGT